MPTLRIPTVLAFLALALPAAQAQQLPATASRDFWCGIAFEVMTRDVPTDPDDERAAAAQIYVEGSRLLLQRAIPILLESGYDDDSLARHRRDVTAAVTRAIVSGTGKPDYSFQECSALIGQ
ncbi:hypothetical protein [Devosia sp.]|uniref:hypothetical protein n=1 Tax=Devosia sp. TaxID=1871048 RepID=UPI003A913060